MRFFGRTVEFARTLEPQRLFLKEVRETEGTRGLALEFEGGRLISETPWKLSS
jgi:hypothetical protein